MARPLRRLSLDRRTLLRGAGASIALPTLDAMTPALRSVREPEPRGRAVFVFQPNGVSTKEWLPEKDHRRKQPLPKSLRALERHREHLTIFRGLTIDAGFAHGDGPGDHARSAASFLTCAHPFKTGGRDIRVGRSIDQELSDLVTSRLGDSAPAYSSLELGMERGSASGVCDSGYSCAYSNHISWRTPTTPVAKETNLRALFERLFGDVQAVTERVDRRRRLRSVLDVVQADSRSLRRTLSPTDRAKLDEYFTSVRELETRIEALSKQEDEMMAEVPGDLIERHLADGFPGELKAMYELIALALRTDRTRVVTLMLGNAGSNRSYRYLDGLRDGHHSLSHHRKDPKKLDTIRRIDEFHIDHLAGFADHLAATDDDGESLLQRTAVVFGSGISDGNRHNHNDLPFLTLGRCDGNLKPLDVHATERNTPAANLYLSLLLAFGGEHQGFADSTGPCSEILAG